MSQISTQYVSVVERGDVRVVTITEEKILNDKVIEGIQKELNALLEDECKKRFIIDFQMTTFVCSSMLGKLDSFKRGVKARGGTLVLCGMNTEIHGLFLLTNLVKIFEIRKDSDEAMNSF